MLVPFAAGDAVVLGSRQGEPNGSERLRAVDPQSGEILTLGRGPHGRRFEVMYHAQGAAAGDSPAGLPRRYR
jgi:hypothetical protein